MQTRMMHELPRALDAFDEIAERLRGGDPVVALDYDGTLTPIVAHADEATMEPAMRSVLERLAARVPVVVMSGRDRLDVAARVGVDGLWYAGSHGFEIAGPDASTFEHPEAGASRAALDAAFGELEAAAADVPGAWVERKRHAVALHYREVEPSEVDALVARLDAVGARDVRLRRTGGKKVAELRPNVEWDKGAALTFLLTEVFSLDRPVPVFVGDDLTDEDAFAVVRATGVGCVVEGGDHPTRARYRLADTAEVRVLLEALAGVV